MGGYSEMCPYCGRWWVKMQAIGDHVKAKHPENLQSWRAIREKNGPCVFEREQAVFLEAAAPKPETLTDS